MSYSKSIIIGNLTADPEIRYTQKGGAIANITIAVNRRWKTDMGEPKESVSFIGCKCFGKTAENINQYFTKGSPIFVEGRLEQETWEDKQTQQKRSKLVVSIETFQFVGGKKESNQTPKQESKIDPADMPGKSTETTEEMDDVPF